MASPFSSFSQFNTCFLLAPTAPRNLRVLSEKSSLPVSIAWDRPAQPNGKITSYSIEVFKIGPNTTETYNAQGSNTVFNVTSLDVGNKYYFRVSRMLKPNLFITNSREHNLFAA